MQKDLIWRTSRPFIFFFIGDEGTYNPYDALCFIKPFELYNLASNNHYYIILLQVGWLKAKDQTILALHHRVITHNERFGVDHDDNRIWKLKIRSVSKSDAGCYMCQINTETMKKQVGCIDVLSKNL